LAGFLHCALETYDFLDDFFYKNLYFLMQSLIFCTKMLDFLYEKSE